MIEVIAFVGLSVGLAYLSRASLSAVRSHGFFRFFAFEGILALIVINSREWFRNPLSIPQVFSWLLLLGSLLLALHGFYLLRFVGKPEGGIEDTTRIVKQGAYKYIRHPLYSSLLLFAWGAFLKGIALTTGILVVLVAGFLVVTAKVEERENLERFGEEYAAYMKGTRVFIPFLF